MCFTIVVDLQNGGVMLDRSRVAAVRAPEAVVF